VTGESIKHVLRQALGAAGYAVRDVGRGVAGVDLFHDARTLLRDVSAPILFDVGANIGQTTQAMLDAFTTPRIHAFEPSPATFETLRRNVAQKPGVTVERVAMGDTGGTSAFHVTRDHSVNDSLLAPVWQAGSAVVDVDVDTIDGYCERTHIDRIDLLKIDTQGFDLRVLHGARRMLAARRVTLYSCEANMRPMYDGQATLRELLRFADEAGYSLVGFYEQSYIGNQLSYLDGLFVAN
jgi:FkbM family methyltransferase